MKLVENLVNRLLDDLNRGRLTEEEVRQLSGYAMDIVYNRIKGLGVGYEISRIAENVVDFTLDKILHDLRSGALPHEEVTEMAAALVGKSRDTDFSDISICSDDEHLQVYLFITIIYSYFS